MGNTKPLEHRLSEINENDRTAWCVGCLERVDINIGNKSSWQCGPANRARAKAWRETHPDRALASKTAYRQADPEKFAAQRLAASTRYNAKNREKIRAKVNALREQQRAQVIEAYGGRCNCSCCHVVHAILLTVDHIKGDGAAQRRLLGTSSRTFYRWLIVNGFPAGYQLLCGSCNLAKADRDKCPLSGEDH